MPGKNVRGSDEDETTSPPVISSKMSSVMNSGSRPATVTPAAQNSGSGTPSAAELEFEIAQQKAIQA